MFGLLAMAVLPLPGAPAEENDTATIVNSGSTNRPGFRIAVARSGIAEMTSTPRGFAGRKGAPSGPTRRTLPQSLVEKFYSDLNAAKPLSALPAVHCAKSVSFGSTLAVAFGGEQTPDLSCGDGEIGRAHV